MKNMQQQLPLLFSVWMLFSLLACQNSGQRNIKKFYFPVESLRAGKVYEYQSLNNDTTEREYWYLRSFETDSGMFLVTTFYDRHFKINQILREKIVSNGSLAKSLFLYEVDFRQGKEYRIEPSIEVGNLFPFEVNDSSGIFLYKLHYPMPGDSAARVYLIRNRRFGGDAPKFSFKNESLPTVRFTLSEVLGHEKEGTAEGQAMGEEWYAEGVGLVQFIKSLGRGNHSFTREFRLRDIYPMTELEQKARGTLLPEQPE